MMISVGTISDSAQAASQILTAMHAGDLISLESGLDQAERLANHQPGAASHAVEQMELLGAVANQMRRSMNRFGRQLTPDLEGVEVHLKLLRHLTKLPPRISTNNDEPLNVS